MMLMKAIGRNVGFHPTSFHQERKKVGFEGKEATNSNLLCFILVNPSRILRSSEVRKHKTALHMGLGQRKELYCRNFNFRSSYGRGFLSKSLAWLSQKKSSDQTSHTIRFFKRSRVESDTV